MLNDCSPRQDIKLTNNTLKRYSMEDNTKLYILITVLVVASIVVFVTALINNPAETLTGFIVMSLFIAWLHSINK